ncbi:MAG: VOC family protein [Sandaracinaceae bacterium]
MRIHHVQLMIPRGQEARARAFYGDELGLECIPKPSDMPNPEGVWFLLGDQQLHLGVQDGPPSPTRAHVAFEVPELDALLDALEQAGHAVRYSNDVGGLRRAHVSDPFGNRLEIMGR